MSDRYAKALERALYNWYYCGDGAPTALIAVVEWFEEHPDVVMNVYLCSFTDNEYKFYLNLIKS